MNMSKLKLFLRDFFCGDFAGMDRKFPAFPVLCLIAFCWIFPGCFCTGLASGDETRVAGIAAEMYLKQDWVVPYLNGIPFLEYPPLFYQVLAVSFAVFGVNEFAAIFPCVCIGILTVLLLYAFCRESGMTRLSSLLSGLCLVTMGNFLSNTRTVRVDILFSAMILLANYGFLLLCVKINAVKKERIGGFFLLAAGVGGAVMTKGFAGAVLTASAMGTFLIADDCFSHKFHFLRYVQTGFACLISLLPAVLWGAALYRKLGAGAVYTVAVTNGIGRFSGSQGDHVSPVYAYLLKFPETFAPWQLFIIGGAVLLAAQFWRKRGSSILFSFLMLLMPYLLLTASSAKRMVYLLILTPAAALAAGVFVERTVQYFPKLKERLSRVSLRQYLLCGAIAGVLFNAVAVMVWNVRKPNDSVVSLYREAAEISAGEQRKIVLKGAGERMLGAAVFYLKRNVPFDKEKKAAGKDRELWIMRTDKRFRQEKSDRHKFFRIPEEYDQFQKYTGGLKK